MDSKLHTHVVSLARAQKNRADAEHAKDVYLKQWLESDPKFQELDAAVMAARQRESVIVEFLKRFAMSLFHRTQSKKVHPNVTIQERSRLVITDEEAAIDWIFKIEKQHEALSIKKAVFNKLAKVLEPDCAAEESYTLVSISSNLSGYLGEEDHES